MKKSFRTYLFFLFLLLISGTTYAFIIDAPFFPIDSLGINQKNIQILPDFSSARDSNLSRFNRQLTIALSAERAIQTSS
jgi:hypothetical protein